MRYLVVVLVLCISSLFAIGLYAQSPAPQATATCNFDTDKQMAVEYQRITINTKKPVFGHEIPYGRVWAPGGKPMTLFLNSPVTVDGKNIPVGAYTMFVIPSEKQWTLIVSKQTDTSGKYDQHQDLLRAPMDFGQLPNPEGQFSVYFAHIAPNQCSMRLDLADSRAWAIFQEQK